MRTDRRTDCIKVETATSESHSWLLLTGVRYSNIHLALAKERERVAGMTENL